MTINVLTKEQQERFDAASTQISDYYEMAYGRRGLGYFMTAIEEYPDFTLKEIYELMYDDSEDEDEEEE